MLLTKTDNLNDYLTRIKNLIKKDNKNLIISINREKNAQFMAEYGLHKKDVIHIIMELTQNHFHSILQNEHESFKDEKLYVFKIQKELTNTRGITKFVTIYIKFNLLISKVIVISFHEDKR